MKILQTYFYFFALYQTISQKKKLRNAADILHGSGNTYFALQFQQNADPG